MAILNRKEPLILFVGDIFFFALALWFSLYLRYFRLPTASALQSYVIPFSILFVVWILIFFIAGLYDKQTVILKSRLPLVIFNTQIVNSIIAVLFFYFIPYFGITPKTNLFIDLIVSFGMIVFWRIQLYDLFGSKNKQPALLIGTGEEMLELRDEVNHNTRYDLRFISSIDLNKMEGLDFEQDILTPVYANRVSVIAVDLRNPKAEPLLPHLYNLIFSNIIFIDEHRIYEDIFDRIPLSLLKYSWFLENISTSPNVVYDALKRIMDIVVAFVAGVISLVVYPFVFLAIKIEDGGSLFIGQERIGKNNQIIHIYKFRSMSKNLTDLHADQSENKVTRVGAFLRMSRIDELPQLWSVLKGDLSLIGPRPELPSGVKLYEKEIPYYAVRHIIKPGLSGWAQIYGEHPHHGVDVDVTKNKLSYDLYYIKNRSFLLDLKIALKTLKTLILFVGK